ncbi:MAG: DUF2130 domain-containing protein [Candidatus Saccharibacteria bacterium]|nr:DUF2130 domain-containing protein [Candidatus Saccharibacteria bacterium]
MKTVKVTIQDENTLILQEDANKGDKIDLKSIHETDIDKDTISSVISSIKSGAFNEEVEKAVKAVKRESELTLQLKEKGIADKAKEEISKKDATILELQNKIENSSTAIELEVRKAVSSVEKERDELKVMLSAEELDKQRTVSSLTDKYETQIKDRDDSIERLRDMKAKLNIKLLGENLEQHCQNEFNNVRTKGDYIYRDYESKGGVEVISIMFEMKDEQDTSENKRTIESHLKKLDSDRTKKNCEYAILVTLLEADNELYNRGIVDLSYKYEKMYVIRPQFFLPLVSILKNTSLKSAEDKRQLVLAKNSNIEIENFVDNMEDWKGGWLKIMKNAGSKHVEGIEQINKAIKDLEKARDALMMSDKHLLTAENKVDDLTVKRLTKNAPSVAERLKEQEKEQRG